MKKNNPIDVSNNWAKSINTSKRITRLESTSFQRLKNYVSLEDKFPPWQISKNAKLTIGFRLCRTTKSKK